MAASIATARFALRTTRVAGMRAVLVLFLIRGSMGAPAEAWAQIRVQIGPNGVVTANPDYASGVILPTDRALSRAVRQAQQGIAEGRFTESLALLDEVLGRDEDLFIDAGDDPQTVGLKSLASGILDGLSSEGRSIYESAYGPVAKRKLVDALQAGDSAQISRIALRYFNTSAGRQAALLQALREADAGRHQSAALAFERLRGSNEADQEFGDALAIRAAASWLAAGNQSQAVAILQQLSDSGTAQLRIGSRREVVPKFQSRAAAIAWLEENLGPNVKRSEPTDPQFDDQNSDGLPHMWVRWKARLLYPALEPIYRELSTDLLQSGEMIPPAGEPVVCGEHVLIRSPSNLLAIHFTTGKLMWRISAQEFPQLDELIRSSSADSSSDADPEPMQAFARRIWKDRLWGSVAADDRYVYAIGDLSMPSTDAMLQMPMGFGMDAGRQDFMGETNRLSAYDVADRGKLVWEIDGAANEGELAGAFFLGAPLVLENQLYCIVEIKGEGEGAVYAIALDRRTGRLQWRQQIANLELGIRLDLQRRMQSVTPAYESGILVCPIGAGAAVGINVRSRTLAWAYRYEAKKAASPYDRRSRDDKNLASRWDGAPLTISKNRVLLTPYESDALHCIDLRSGELLWQRPRGDFLRLACVHEDQALLIGNDGALAVRLDNGKPAWESGSIQWPTDVFPTGAGFVSRGDYYLPLSSAEVIAVNLESGQISNRTASRDGAVLGNLVAHDGAVIVYDGEGLSRYDRIDALQTKSQRRLEQDPRDVAALRSLAEIAYNQGRLDEALQLLDRAYAVDPEDLDTREVFAECLTAALDEDFVAYRDRLGFLRRVLSDSPNRLTNVLRIESEGLLEAGDVIAATEPCILLYRSNSSMGDVLQIGRDHEVAASRWVRAQLSRIWDRADETQQAALRSKCEEELERLGDSNADLSRFVSYFGDLPPFEAEKLQLAKRRASDGQLLAGQQLLLELADSSNVAVSAQATAILSKQLHGAGMHDFAQQVDRRLDEEFAAVECLDGLTGRQCLEIWVKSPSKVGGPDAQGRVDVAETQTNASRVSPGVRMALAGMRIESSDETLENATALMGERTGEVVVRDGRGREVFQARAESSSGRYYRRYSSAHAKASGTLMVTSSGRQLAAFNLLAGQSDVEPDVLWRKNLVSNLDVNQSYSQQGAITNVRPGTNRAARATWEDRWIGVIGPVNGNGCVYQDQRRLICVDSISGDQVWAVDDVPLECELFGDDQLVAAVPRGSTTARLYSMVDGRRIGESIVPSWRELATTRGRFAIRWGRTSDAQYELASIDARDGEVVWRHRFAESSQIDVDKGRFIAVYEPGVRITVVDAEDGRRLIDHPVSVAGARQAVHLSAGADAFVLATSKVGATQRGWLVRSLSPRQDYPIVDGEIYAFDRKSGRMQWARPAEVSAQGLILTQPVDLPVIVFAGRLNRQSPNRTPTTMAMLVLDKRTGRTLYRSQDLPLSSNGFCVVSQDDEDPRVVRIQMASRTVSLRFTDEHRPPAPPALAEVEARDETGSGGIGGLGFKLFRELRRAD